MPARIEFGGVPVDDVTQSEAVSRILELARTPGLSHVVTVNPEFVMLAQEHRQFREVLLQSDLALPDGVGLIWGSRILRRALRGRATGVGTVVALAEASAAPAGPSIFLLGAAPGVAASAAARLQERFPGARIAGTWSGSPAESDWPEIGHLIDTASPDILLVAFGAPAQDLWIAAHRGELTCRVAMGIGGSLDYIAGVVPYAPAWVRRLGLEWLYRLIRQPWRWRRMLRLPRFVWLMLLQRPRR